MDYTVPMAIVDFVPVFLFGAAAVILLCDLYNRLYKGAYAIVAAGFIDIFVAGFSKALHKLLYAMGVCDFEKLSAMFFPLQSIGFILAGLGMASLLRKKNRNAKVNSFAPLYLVLAGTLTAGATEKPPVFSGTMIFVSFMVLGIGLICLSLSVMGAKLKKPAAIALFSVTFVCLLSMGYLSTKDFGSAGMNWLGEGLNTAGQICFLAGAVCLRRAGLGNPEKDRY
jgi:hypothetical protein